MARFRTPEEAQAKLTQIVSDEVGDMGRFALIDELSLEQIEQLIPGGSGTTAGTAQKYMAVRQAMQAVHERKIALMVIAAADRSARSTTLLTWAALGLAGVQILLGAIQILVSFKGQ